MKIANIVMLVKYFFIVLITVVSFHGSQANEVALTVSAPSEVAVGQRFRLSFSVNAQASEFSPPAFDSFRILSGPSQSSSTSTQIINQQVTTSITISYNYVLEATQEGRFTIGNAAVRVNGTTYRSDPYTIRVVAATQQPQPSQPRHDASEPELPGSDDIFIRAVAGNNEPYHGQQVVITYKLYTRLDITNYSIDALPSFQDFWSENLTNDQRSITNEIVNGVNYRVAEIRRVAVFPQRSGELRIDPMTVNMGVRVRRPQQQRRGSMFDEFFGSSPFDRFQTIQHSVRSNAVTLNVKSLPVQNRPADFKGVVGNYQFTANVSPEELEINDAVNMVLTIEGSGNIRMLEAPSVQFPRHLEVFDPRIEDNVRTGRSGISGSRQFEYLMIPRSGGLIEIPTVRFSFFDPARSQYITREAGPFTLNVSGDAIPGSGLSAQADATMFADEIRFINTQVVSWQPIGVLFFRSPGFYYWIVSPIVLLVIVLIIYRKQLKNKQDEVGMRTRKARKIAVKRLKLAHKFLKEEKNNAFYDEVFRALWGYVSDRLNIPVSKLNKDNIAEAFNQKGVSVELAEEFLAGLTECEYARFAPASLENPMQESYDKALQTIITLEKELNSSSLRVNNRPSTK